MLATSRILYINSIHTAKPKKTPLSNARLEIAISILDETKNRQLAKRLVHGICQVDPWVRSMLSLYGFKCNVGGM
jgi:hypothetical protein